MKSKWSTWILRALTTVILGIIVGGFDILADMAGAGRWSVAVGSSLGILVLLASYANQVKKALLAYLAKLSPPKPCDLKSFPACDTAYFDTVSGQLQARGFEFLGDFEQSSTLEVVIRTLHHPRENCVANILQVLASPKGPLKPSLSLWSLFPSPTGSNPLPAPTPDLPPIAAVDLADDPVEDLAPLAGYGLCSTNMKVTWLSSMGRHERVLQFSSPLANPLQLVEEHLSTRLRAAEKIGEPWSADLQSTVFAAFHYHLQRVMVARLRKRPALIILWRSWRARKDTAYWGDLR